MKIGSDLVRCPAPCSSFCRLFPGFTKRARDNLAWWCENVVGFHQTNAQLAQRFAEPPFAVPGMTNVTDDGAKAMAEYHQRFAEIADPEAFKPIFMESVVAPLDVFLGELGAVAKMRHDVEAKRSNLDHYQKKVSAGGTRRGYVALPSRCLCSYGSRCFLSEFGSTPLSGLKAPRRLSR